MNVFITGGSGFVGRHLSEYLLEKGCKVVATGRSQTIKGISHPNYRYLSADTSIPGDWQEELPQMDAVVNLAGVNIFNYWTKGYKQSIYDSRIQTTRNIVDALPEGKGISLISTSALGFYGDRGDDLLKESEPVGSDFLAKVCRDWETEALKARTKGSKVAIARFAVVLDKHGGALKMMLPPFRLFVGGPLGSGNQWFPWIHLQDLIQALWFLLEQEDPSGTYNFCAPTPITNREMSRSIGRALHRPSIFRVPAFAIRMVIGELGSMVLFSQRGEPQNLLKAGFNFGYPTFESALNEIVGK